MRDLTEDEYDALDELWTNTTPKLNTSKEGYYTRHKARLVELDELSAAYLRAKADAISKTPSEIIGEMVRKELALAAA